jgi:hypothetical protein
VKYPNNAGTGSPKDIPSKKVKMSLLGYGDCMMWLVATFSEAGKLSIYVYASSSSSDSTPSPLFPLDISGSSITLSHPSDSKNNDKNIFPKGSMITRTGVGCGWSDFIKDVRPFVNCDGDLRINAVFRINQPKDPLII